MKKFVQVAFSTGHVYEVATSIIAKDRTDYYAMSDPGRTRQQHEAETGMLFASEFELFDWAKNNMNWSDLQKHARLVSFKAPDFAGLWDAAELSTCDEQSVADVTKLGEASITAPIELAMAQAFGEGRNCMMLAFQQRDTGAVTSAIAVMVGPQQLVEGYIAVISNFDTFMEQQRANTPAAASH